MRRFNFISSRPPQMPSTLQKQYCTLLECYRKSLDKVDIKAHPDEVVLNVFHQHWFVNIRWILVAVTFFIFPVIIFPLIESDVFTFKYRLITIAFWYLVVGIYVFESFIDWFFDSYIITNQRVINIDFSNYINKKISEANIKNIQDISTRISGLSQTFFNYGTVHIQTASSTDVIVFKNIPNPETAADTIDKLRSLAKTTNGGLNE